MDFLLRRFVLDRDRFETDDRLELEGDRLWRDRERLLLECRGDEDLDRDLELDDELLRA